MTRTKQIVAVTGGSGHLGVNLVLKLLEDDYKVKALFFSQKPEINHPNLEWVQGNILDALCIDNLIKNADVIIHCAGMVAVKKESREQVLEINAFGTQNIIDVCLASPKKIRFIYISSITVADPTPRTRVMSESRRTTQNSNFAYSWSKLLAEQNVIKAIEEHNLDAFIIRPAALFGPPDYKPSIFGDVVIQLINNKFPINTSGGYNFLDVRDAAQTIINSIESGERGEVYHLGGHYLSLPQAAKLISKYSGSKLPWLILNVNIILLIEPLVTWYFDRKGAESPFTKENLYFLKHGIIEMDNTKAEALLQHRTRPIEESFKDLIEWLKKSNTA